MKEFFDVTREGCLQAGGDNFGDFGLCAGVHGAFEQFEGLGFRLAGVGGERAAPGGRLGPAGRDGEDFLVEADRAGAIKRKASKQDDARDGIGSVGEAGAGEVMMNEALGENQWRIWSRSTGQRGELRRKSEGSRGAGCLANRGAARCRFRQ